MRVVCRRTSRFTRSPAAHLTPSVGPLASPKAVAGQFRQRDIIGHIRASSGHRPGIVRAYPDTSGHVMIVACERSRCRIACRKVACARSRCRIACRKVACARSRCRTRRGGWSSRAVWPIAGSRAVSPVAHSRLVTSRPTLATSRLCHVPVRHAARPSSAHPRPNSACRRRRHRRFTNIFSFTWPWRFMNARSAARLRRGVGPLSRHGACRTGEPLTSL